MSRKRQPDEEDADNDASMFKGLLKKLKGSVDLTDSISRVISMFIQTVPVGNPIIRLNDVISGTDALESRADTRIILKKLGYLKTLELSQAHNILLHEIPILTTELLGIYINSMDSGESSSLVDAVESGIKFLLWWFTSEERDIRFIRQSFVKLDLVVKRFQAYQVSTNYKGFNEQVHDNIYTFYIEGINVLNNAVFSGMEMETRFIDIARNTASKATVKMLIYSAVLILFDAAFPTFLELCNNATVFSKRYRIIAYSDLLICTLLLEAMAPDIALGLKSVVPKIIASLILIWPLILKGYYSTSMLQGRLLTKEESGILVKDMVSDGLVIVGSLYMGVASFSVNVLYEIIKSGLNGGSISVMVSSLFYHIAGVFTSAEKLRRFILGVVMLSSVSAISYELLTETDYSNILYFFESSYDEGMSYAVTKGGGEYLDNLIVKFISTNWLITAFIPQEGDQQMPVRDYQALSLRFTHTGIKLKEGKTIASLEMVSQSKPDNKETSLLVKLSMRASSLIKILIVASSALATTTILSSFVPTEDLSSPVLSKIDIRNKLVSNLGYKSYDGKTYQYDVNGIKFNITRKKLDLLVATNEFKTYAKELSFMKELWTTNASTSVSTAWEGDFEWERKKEFLALVDSKLVNQYDKIVRSSMTVLKLPEIEDVVMQADYNASRIMLNSYITEWHKLTGSVFNIIPSLNANISEAVDVRLNLKGGALSLSFLKERLQFARDNVIIGCLKVTRHMFRSFETMKIPEGAGWFVAGLGFVSFLLLQTYVVSRVILKGIELYMKERSKAKSDEIVKLPDTSIIDTLSWFLPVTYVLGICIETGKIATGKYSVAERDFWAGYWGVDVPYKSIYYKNGEYYASKPLRLLAQHAFLNFNYILPRPVSTELIIQGAYVPLPPPKKKTKG